MEYRLKASIRKTMNADRSYILTGVGTYDFVGSMVDVDFISQCKPLIETETVTLVDEGLDDTTNTCKVLEVVNLLEE